MEKRYYCRTCKGERKYKVVCERKTTGTEAEGAFEWNDDYYIIECLGCETISFLQVYGDSTMRVYDDDGRGEYYVTSTIYPNFLEMGREIDSQHLLPPKIIQIYKETITAFKSNAFILTAGGFRAILEALCNHVQIRKDDLSKRIDLLAEKGVLSTNEAKRLHAIRFLGNDALHEMELPNYRQLLVLLEIVNHLLENLFVQDKLIVDTVETLVDDYGDFVRLLGNKIRGEIIGQDLTLKEILGKSRRLIRTKLLTEFESRLIIDIQSGKIDFLTITKRDTDDAFRIMKRPPASFFF